LTRLIIRLCMLVFLLGLSPGAQIYGQQIPGSKKPTTLAGISVIVTATNPQCGNIVGLEGYILGNGIIIASASGGTPPYLYALLGQTPTQNIGYFPGLYGITYTLRITDATGLIKDTAITLSYSTALPIVTTQVNKLPSSCTSSDGSITLVGSGGTPPYTYSFDGGVSFSTNNTVTNLQQGFYYFYIKDANGCLNECYTEPAPDLYNYFFCYQCCNLMVNVGYGSAASNTSCSNTGDVLEWTVTGTPPYLYSMDGINFQPANVLLSNYISAPGDSAYNYTNLPPGVYHLYIKDATGAIAASSVTVPKSCYIAITFIGVDASCGQSDGSLTVSVVNGTPPYTYTMDGVNFQTSNVFTGLSSGNYSVTARDANGEIYSSTATVYNKCPTVSAVETDETCGQNNGTITATGQKGTTPYQFSIDGINYQSSNQFSGLPSGNYTVTLRDAMGFTSTYTLTIQNNCVQLALVSTNTTCGFNNGSIIATGSSGLAPYQYSIDGINFQTVSLFSNLLAGPYTVTVKDANGLTASSIVTLTDAPGPQISTSTNPASCSNTNGTITITAAGGTAPLLYSIDGGINFQTSNIFAGLDSGQYQVLVKDANGCTANSATGLTALPTPVVFLGEDTTVCAGIAILLTAPPGAGYQYEWQDNSAGNNLTATGAGIYWVKVSNLSGCSASDTIQISYTSLPVFSLGNDSMLCGGHTLLLQPEPLLSGTYLWSSGSTGSSLLVGTPGIYWLKEVVNGCSKTDSITLIGRPMPVLDLGDDTVLCTGQTLLLNASNNNATYIWQDGSTNASFLVNNPGTYSVKVDEAGCDSSGSVNIAYIAKPVVNIGNDTTVCIGYQLLLDASSPAATYLWQDGSTSPHFNVTQGGIYSVDVTNACGDSKDTIQVAFENCACKFYIPNAFTPNNDGRNDLFRLKYQCQFSNYELKIFNRWGQLIFTSRNASEGWDGNYGGQPQPVGSYVWELGYTDNLTGKNIRKSGTVVLIR
jgi:gliding motility-associated-like protein